MKLHILSDVHLEFGKWPKAIDVNAIDADVSILAGDIGVGLEGLEWALTFDRPVIYVMGNHEFYGQRTMTELWRKAREKVADTHVHLLENESILIPDPTRAGESIRFLGATLWTDFSAIGPEKQEQCITAAKQSMSDYSAIYVSKRGRAVSEPGYASQHVGDRLTPRKTLSMHYETRDFLEHELARQPDPMGLGEAWAKTVVVTHHAPSGKSLTYGKPISNGDTCYVSNLDHLAAMADLWVHGHIHVSVDYAIPPGGESGRVVSNPRGYVGHDPVRDFNPALVVTV